MASPESSISQVFAPGTNYWDNPANWAKPVQGNQFTTGTQALNSVGSINSENPAATAFASSSQGPQGGGFNPQSSVPQGSQSTPQNTNTGTQNSSVGNTGSQTSGTANNIMGINENLLNQGQSQQSSTSNSSSSGQSSSGSGLSGFSNLVGSLGNQAGNALGLSGQGSLTSQITGGINEAGLGFGFGTGSSTLGAVTGNEASLLAGYGVAPGASSAASASAADTVGGFSGYGANAGGELTSASLGGVLGGAGLGAGIGSVYGMLTGKTGAQATNADIGGALGGAGGAVLGAELGSVIPGIGTVIGGVAGSIIGGLFGPGAGTSDSGQAGTLMANGGIDPNSVITGGKNPSSGTQSFVSSANNQFSSLSQSASSALGIKFNTSLDFNAQDSTLHGGPWIAVQPASGYARDGTGQISINPTDAGSVASAYYQALTYAANQSGYTDTNALYSWFYGQPTQGANPTQFGNNITIAPQA